MHSMTGFGRAEITVSKGTLVLELQSVNRRHLDMSIFLPKELYSFEVIVKEWLRKRLLRGQITARFFFSAESYKGPSKADMQLLKELKKKWEDIASSLGCAQKEITLPFLLEQIEKSGLQQSYQGEDWEKALYDLTHKALHCLVEMREKEGRAMGKEILASLEKIRQDLSFLVQKYPRVKQEIRKKMQEKLAEFSHLSDQEERLFREAALYAEKMDIAEEIARLDCHLEETKRLVFSSEESVGKQIGFLVQEMLREAHTACVKSSDVSFIKLALSMKGELERIKEQIQNVQ